VPPLVPRDAEERQRFEAAQLRRALRQEMESRNRAIRVRQQDDGTAPA